jgi:2-dehydropantoate 2-reductase
MNICFYGVGGVGGYYGTLVAKYVTQTGKGRTTFIARGKHKDAILANGLRLKKDGGKEEILVRPDLCTDTVDGLPVFDIVVVSVKGYDLEGVAQTLDRIVDVYSVILPLLNGADIYERMRPYVNKGYLLPACVYLGTHIASPGIIFQKGGSHQISVGRDPQYPDFYPENLIDLFTQAGIPIRFFEDVNVEIWTKYIFIAAFALVTATYDKTIGEVAGDETLGRLVKNMMEEMASIAAALNISLPGDIVETSFSKAGQFAFETKTSFQRDVETKGRQSEWDLFGGTVIRYAEQLNIPVRHTKATFDQLMRKL